MYTGLSYVKMQTQPGTVCTGSLPSHNRVKRNSDWEQVRRPGAFEVDVAKHRPEILSSAVVPTQTGIKHQVKGRMFTKGA